MRETDFAVWVRQVNCLLEQNPSEEQNRNCTDNLPKVTRWRNWKVWTTQKRKSQQKHSERAYILDLAHNDFKTAIINILKGKMVLLNKHIGNLNKHMETIREELSGNSRTAKHNNWNI